jgi:hypothetical protein
MDEAGITARSVIASDEDSRFLVFFGSLKAKMK